MTTKPKAPSLPLEKQIEHEFAMAFMSSHGGYELLDQTDGRQVDRLLYVAREYRAKLLDQGVQT